MHEVASLFPLARLAVGFGRKRAAPISGHPLMADALEFTPRPKEEIK